MNSPTTPYATRAIPPSIRNWSGRARDQSSSIRSLRTACEGAAGITPARFRSLLSPEDIADPEAGAIHPKTLKAYALSFAERRRSGRIRQRKEARGKAGGDVHRGA